MTLWLSMMHHQTTFGCKRSSTEEEIVRTVIEIMHLHCDFDLEGNSPIFFHKALKIVTIHYQLSTPKYTAEKGMIFI